MYCKKCGTQNPDEAKFCGKCGAPMAAEPFTPDPSVNVNNYASSTAPVGQLNTNKGLLKYILLSLITFGIYGIVVISSVSNSINIVASRYDGKKTMHLCMLFFLVGPLTLGIGGLVWYHNISAGASAFWLWDVLGALIIIGSVCVSLQTFQSNQSDLQALQ